MAQRLYTLFAHHSTRQAPSKCCCCNWSARLPLRPCPTLGQGARHRYPKSFPRSLQRRPGPHEGTPLGRLQHLQRLDLGRAQPVGLLPGRQPVPAVRQLRQLPDRHRPEFAGDLLPHEPDGLCRRKDRRALPGAGARFVRHLGRQPGGAGARGGGVLLVWRADGGRVGRHRGAAGAQRQPAGLPPEHAMAGAFGPGADLLRRHLGAAAAHHPERHGNRAPLPGLGRPGGVDRHAGAGGRPVHQGRRLQPGARHPDGRAAGQDPRRRRDGRAGQLLGADGGGRHLDHLLRGALPELLRFLALRPRQAGGETRQPVGPAGEPGGLFAGGGRHHHRRLQGLRRGAAAPRADLHQVRQLGAGAAGRADLRGGHAGHQRGGELRVGRLRYFERVSQAHQFQVRRLHRGADRAGAVSVRAVGRRRGPLRQRHRRHHGTAAGHHPGGLLPGGQGPHQCCSAV